MGNEDEVTGIAARGRSLFLPEEIPDQDAGTAVYVLEEEFARTRRNRNYRLYLFVAAVIAAVVGSAFLFKLYRDWRDSIIDVDVTEFEDLRLKEVIDSARKRGSNIDVLQMEMRALEIGMLEEMLAARKETHAREAALFSRGLPDGETEGALKQLRLGEEARLKKIRAAYRHLIRRKQAEIWALEEARSKEEKELKAKSADTRVSSTDRVWALRMNKLREKQETGIEAMNRYYTGYMDFLTLRYNPVIDTQPFSGILAEKHDLFLTQGGFLRGYNPVLGEYGLDKSGFDALRKRIGDGALLLKRLMRVPYQNSVPPALRALDGISGEVIRDYENLWLGLARGIEERKQLLEQYEYTFESMMAEKKDGGLIIDPRDQGNILVHMARSLKIEDGRTASVYNGNQYVGRISLFRDQKGGHRAKIVSLMRGLSIKPGYRIVLDEKK